jgi:CRP-like cAMP-binding protein
MDKSILIMLTTIILSMKSFGQNSTINEINYNSFYDSIKVECYNIEDATLSVRRSGKGPALIFIHGYMVNGYTWRYLIPELSKTYTCYIVESAGFGDTKWTKESDFSFTAHANRYIQLFKKLKLSKYSLVAHDTGGSIARMIAISEKDNVAMDELKKILKDLIQLTEPEWNILKDKLIRKEFKAKSIIIREGKIADCIYFIDKGLLRTYFLQDGKEVNTYFACDGQFITSYSSFISQTPSYEYLETIENSSVYSISFANMTELYKIASKFEKLGRIMAEKNYLCVIDRTRKMQTLTAKQKYLDFIDSYDKKIVQRVPQHQIASYLGIAPESLSRVRKHISIS